VFALQGVTEFLPVSSSAHLILPSQLLGWPDQGLAFDVAVHVGTLLAVILAFRHEVAATAVGWTRHFVTRKSRLGWAVIIGTLPAALAALLMEHYVETYARSALVIGISTIVFGLVLWWADATGARIKQIEHLNWIGALLIGLAQALALIPGTSRSGITMTAALMLGFTRQAAAHFSFLLSIPLILAAGGLKTVELIQTGADAQWIDIFWGIGLSFVSALLCIKLLLTALDKIGVLPFVIYRLILGIALLAFSL
jgi:undecaprenyl-diphosphatase